MSLGSTNTMSLGSTTFIVNDNSGYFNNVMRTGSWNFLHFYLSQDMHIGQ